MKAGNPDVIVCQNVFANYFPEVIANFHENQAWPYFDTLNFHHYWSLAGLPKYYAQFRETSAGRPMWVTECNFIHGLSSEGLAVDPQTREFTSEDLRRQAADVLRMFTISIQGGSVATFWFIFPNYGEGPTQFGVIRADLTPRPSYLALAAAGRLLADAKPIGQLKSSNKDLWGYLFRAKPDGKDRLVLVAWTVKGTETIELPGLPSAVYDPIGREQKLTGTTLNITNVPVVGVFPVDMQSRFAYEPAPTMPSWAGGRPSPVVLQAVWPAVNSKSAVSWQPGSNYWISSDGPDHMPFFVYNFGAMEAKGRLTMTGPPEWHLSIQQDVSLQPMERLELGLNFDLSQTTVRTREAVKIEGDFGPAGQSLLSLWLFPLLPAQPKDARDMPALLEAKRWHGAGPADTKFAISAVPEGVLVELDRGSSGQKWFSVSLDVDPKERPTEPEDALMLPAKIVEGEASLSVRLAEDTGRGFSLSYGMGDRAKSDDGAISFGAALTPWTMAEPQQKLDPQKLQSVQIAGEAKTQRVKFLITRAGWARF